MVYSLIILLLGFGTLSPAQGCPQHYADVLIHATQPTALDTGQSLGIKSKYLKTRCPFAEGKSSGMTVGFGLLGAYGAVRENSRAWAVQHDELYVQGVVESLWSAGQGAFGVHFALGGAWVFEQQDRLQAARLSQGSTDDNSPESTLLLQRSAQTFVPIMTVSPIAQLYFIKLDWGRLGLRTEINLHARFPNQQTLDQERWAWGLSLGIITEFSHSSSTAETKE